MKAGFWEQNHRIIPWFVLIIGLLLSYQGYNLALKLEYRTLKLEHESIAQLAFDALTKELEINQNILSSIQRLFIASSEVSRKDFFHFTESVIKSHSAIQALEWIPYVEDEKREAFQQRAVADGLLDYDIRRRNAEGLMVPVKQQWEYYPVYYVEPLNENKAALGFDLASSPTRLKSLEQARQSRQILATASISLVQETDNQKGFLILDPIFRPVNDNSNTEETLFNGFALGVFRIGDLVETAINPIKSLVAPLMIKVIDITDLRNTTLLYSKKVSDQLQPLSGWQWRYAQDIHFANRTWRVSSIATTDFSRQYLDKTHWIVLSSGLVLTLFISLYLRSLINRESAIKSLVLERSHKLDISEKMNQTIIENAVDAVITIDPQGIVRLFSPAAEKLFGYVPQDVIGQNIKMLMPEPYRAEHDGYLKHHRETGEKRIIGIGREVKGQRKDGSIFPMNLSVGKAQINSTTLYIGTVTDLTNVKRKEQALLDFSERLDIATRAGSIGVWDYDVVKGTLDWDKRMFSLYGITKDQFPGAYEIWNNALHPDDLERAKDELNDAIKGGKQFDTEFRIHWPDGEERYIRASAVVLFDDQHEARRMTGVNIDITEQKRTEQALQQAKQLAESANQQKSAFLNTMSHELRTPLTVILGYLPLLKNREHPLPAETVIQVAEDMDISGQHLLEMINDVLDISKIEAGQMSLNLESIQIEPLIDEMLRKFTNQAKQKGIELIKEVNDFTFTVDGRRLRQILINLIGNALKFTSEGSITISATRENQFVTINILDTGIGIPESDLPFIFETFRQVDDSSTRDTGGSGLGLAITKSLVELHGGSISATSDYGSGTTFSFRIKQ